MEGLTKVGRETELANRTTKQNWAGLPVTCLQFPPRIIAKLQSEDIVTLNDLIDYSRGGRFERFRYRKDIITAFSQIAEATSGNNTDWLAYWKHRNLIFYDMVADPSELRSLDKITAGRPVNRRTFGNAGVMLERAGYTTLGSLAEGLRLGFKDIRGMGPGKVQQFFETLVEIIEALRDTGQVQFDDNSREGSYSGDIQLSDIPHEIRLLSVGVLHLGTKSKWLSEAGIRTVGQVVDVWPIEHGDIAGLGPTTLDLLAVRLAELVLSIDENGLVAWDSYCDACNIDLVPASSAAVSGTDFLDNLGDTLAEISDVLPDKIFAEILRSRLARMPEDRATLDEIAQTADPPITRERVRQKEKKLLLQLAGGLIWDSYSGLNVHFRPEFTKWWRIAAARFAQADEIEFNEFVTALANAWDVDVPSLTRQLPIILAIVTGEPAMPAGFRSAIGLDPIYYGNLSDDFVHLPLIRLRLGRYAGQLEAAGICTIGDLVGLWRSGAITDQHSKATRIASEYLNSLACCLDLDGKLDWSLYRETVKLEEFAPSITGTAQQFMTTLPDVVTQLLELCQITLRSGDIFRLRTSQVVEARPTLEKVAEVLNTHGSTIKREETIFLQRLSDMIVDQEYTFLPVWLDASWLDYWREAENLFNQTRPDFNSFRTTLRNQWRTCETDRGEAILWSVLSGYPNGRPPRKEVAIEDIKVNGPIGRIKLKGFRRLH